MTSSHTIQQTAAGMTLVPSNGSGLSSSTSSTHGTVQGLRKIIRKERPHLRHRPRTLSGSRTYAHQCRAIDMRQAPVRTTFRKCFVLRYPLLDGLPTVAVRPESIVCCASFSSNKVSLRYIKRSLLQIADVVDSLRSAKRRSFVAGLEKHALCGALPDPA